MSDLRRRRDARDIWISRRHLAAGGVLMVLTSITSFFLGFWVGRDEAELTPQAAHPIRVPGDDLVELLARVEASALSDGGLETLTFPDTLRGEPGGGPPIPSRPGEPAPAQTILPPHRQVAPASAAVERLSGPPPGLFTVTVASLATLSEAQQLGQTLRALGIDTWIGAEIAEGQARYRLAVGGYPSAEEAARVLPILTAAGFSGTVSPL